MLKVDNPFLRYTFHIPDSDLEEIKNFLRGAAYTWSNSREDEYFAARDLVGGKNRDWDFDKTPLRVLYHKHRNLGKDEAQAIKDAGIDAGWILKLVLSEDTRTYISRDMGKANGYLWVEE